MSQLYQKATLLLGACLITAASFAQTVSGTVVDEAGDPLIGVTVLKKGTTVGTVTDFDGAYSLTADPGDLLVFSYIGFETRETTVTGSSMDVQMGINSEVMTDVVVIGYGEQRREAVTGAVSSVDGREISQLTVANLGEAIQGRLSGVQVINQGQPGSEPIIEVRGVGSINFGTGPLIVVDGQPVGGLNSFDNRDIESISVLKDASSTAVYGSRGANGVLIVTTKSGRGKQGIRVGAESTIGVQQQNRRLNLLNTDQYIQYTDLFLEDGLTRDLDEVVPGQAPGSTQTYRQTNTDWQDAIFQNGLLTQNSVNVSGGNDVSSFYASGGYLKQEGVIINTPYERYNFRINSDHNLGGGFSFGQTLGVVYDQRDISFGNPFIPAWRQIPYLPIRDSRNIGGFSGADQGLDSADPANPVAFANLLKNQDQVGRLIGTAYAGYEFLNGFKVRAMYGLSFTDFTKNGQDPIYQSTLASIQNTVFQNRSRSYNPLLNVQLGYNRIFGDHSIDALVVGEEQQFMSSNSNVSGQYPTNDFVTVGGADNIQASTSEFKRVLQSFVGRVAYSYQGKYLVSASARQDANSALAPGSREEVFYAGALGWRISQEPFMANTPFSELKLRASYGQVGNDFGRAYSFQSLINQNANAVTLDGENQATIARILNSGNPDLSWEKTDMFNIGLDAGFLNNRINFSVEYYDRNVDNLIDDVALAPSTGLGPTTANIGALTNSGFEFQGAYFSKPNTDFRWNVRLNLSRATNEVLRLASDDRTIERNNQGIQTGNFTSAITRVGDPIGSFYGFVVDGIIRTEADLANGPTQEDETGVGDFRYRDINGLDDEGNETGMPDGVIDNLDRTIIGSYLPDFVYGANFGASYKNFDLSLFFQGSQGNDIYNGAKALTYQTDRLFNVAEERLTGAFSATNPNADIPAVRAGDPNNNNRTSSFFVEDGSYMRLKNLTLGYRFDLPFRSSTSSLRVYGSAQNLFTITGYSGLDPEIGGGQLSRGFDNGVYPQGQSFLVGAQVQF